MEKFYQSVGAFMIVFATIAAMACVHGTILYFIYPHIHALFPTAAEHGIIAKNLAWWDSVCVCWILAILIKSNGGSSSSKKD